MVTPSFRHALMLARFYFFHRNFSSSFEQQEDGHGDATIDCHSDRKFTRCVVGHEPRLADFEASMLANLARVDALANSFNAATDAAQRAISRRIVGLVSWEWAMEAYWQGND